MVNGSYIMRGTLFLTVACFVLYGCSIKENNMSEFHLTYGGNIENVGILLQEAVKQNIFFGHQSVGWNIISGIEKWEEEAGIKLLKTETRDFKDIDDASFTHFAVGKNADPLAKIDDFVSLVGTIPKTTEPIAFFKFCYVDIIPSTNTDELFDYYKERMHHLSKEHPEIKVVLMTVPLTGIQKGWKSIVKHTLGKVPYGYLENIKRSEFNKMIIEEFSGVFPIFDLARVESTLPDGTINTFSYKEAEYPCVPDFYTSDLGHLNDYGAKVVSYNLLAFLAEEVK
jgi:hypothetical protein